MTKYRTSLLFIILLVGICFADIVVLKNGESFNGLVIGIKENSILFKSENNGYIFLRTETIDHLGLSSGEIIIKDNSLNISTPQNQKFLEKYEENYLLNTKLYQHQQSYKSEENIVVVGCCFIAVAAILLISSGSSKSSNDNSGFWRAFESFWNGFVND